MRVLVVQHDPGEATAIANALRARGHEVSVAPSGERAIDEFVQRASDAVIADLSLPGRDGAATIESIRWAPGGDRVLAVVTGVRERAQAPLDEAARRVGAIAIGAGRLDPEALATLIESAGTSRTSLPPPSTKRLTSATAMVTGNTDATPLEEATEIEGGEEGRLVEHLVAEGTSRARAAQTGDLGETPFARLLPPLARKRMTGTLAVVASSKDTRPTTTGNRPQKTIFFHSGVPVYAQSNLLSETLGYILVRSGRISDDQRRASIERMQRGEGRQGSILLAMGAIAPRALRDALEEQLHLKLVDLFAWSDGLYAFTEDSAVPPEVVTLASPLEAILLEGIERRLPPERLRAELGPILDRYLVPIRERAVLFIDLQLVPRARAALDAIDGTTQLGDLLGGPSEAPEIAALVYAMLVSDAIEVSDTPRAVGRIRPRVGGARPVAMPSPAREDLHRVAEILRGGELTALAAAVENLLGIPADDEVGALSILRDRLAPFAEPGATSREVRALAYEIVARSETLLAAQSQDETSGLTTDHRGANVSGRGDNTSPELLDVSSPTTPLPPSRHPSSRHTRELEPPSSAAPFRPPANRDLDDWDDDADLPEESTTSITNQRVEKNDSLDDQVARVYEAERQFRRGEASLEQNRLSEALAAFERAVALCPEEGEFIAHRAWARFRLGRGASRVTHDALTDLERATRLSPKVYRAHFYLGEVARALGDTTRARDAYERCLTANPECNDALIALRELDGAR